ncbi:hypothetical protein [Methyloceanibacter sp. wino2]|uniref:hypothetical protein n=1 Tax=Methyloceanibacter sp. wino2 TaxID=2170729 RepID=UPI00131EEFB9|nr:hypothetical protein [Methyloceanibacter sp. wino2]
MLIGFCGPRFLASVGAVFVVRFYGSDTRITGVWPCPIKTAFRNARLAFSIVIAMGSVRHGLFFALFAPPAGLLRFLRRAPFAIGNIN